jgi:hypothetical protein
VQCDPERLEERRRLIRDRVWERVDEMVGPGDECAQCAVRRSVPSEAHVGAQVPLPRKTQRAPSARHSRVEYDALAGARAVDDDAGELVAEDERLAQHRIADPSLEEPMAVGAAQPDAADAHERVALPRLGVRLVVQQQLAGRVETQRLHVGWP